MIKIWKKGMGIISMVMVLSMLAGCQKAPAKTSNTESGQKTDGEYTIATVVKVSGVAWFDRMDEGVKEFAKTSGINAYQTGPQEADAALQVQIIEDLIAQNVDAICVVPNSSESLEPILKKAKDKGIVVIAHEGEDLTNIDYDLEAFDHKLYGEHLMQNLAKDMNEEGEYALYVGSLTSRTHKIWVESAEAYQKEYYPNMTRVGDIVETTEDQKTAYEKTKELLRAYPNIAGIQGSSSSDAPGIALAIEELGLQEQVSVVGTSLVSLTEEYLESGAADIVSCWDPKDAGYAMNELALKVLKGEDIKNDMDLSVSGYNNVTLDNKILRGSAWVDITKENKADYPF